MSVLKNISSPAKISGAEVYLTTAGSSFFQGDEISGSLFIKAGEHRQNCNSVSIALEEFWQEICGSRSKFARQQPLKIQTVVAHKTFELADQFAILPYSEFSFPFKFELPRNCRLTTGNQPGTECGFGVQTPLQMPQSGWRLQTYLDLSLADEKCQQKALKVKPSVSLLTIIEVLESEKQFEELLSSRRWDSQSSETCFILVPPEELKSKLASIGVKLKETKNAGVEGWVIFDLRVSSKVDQIKRVVFGTTMLQRRITLSSDQIYSSDGKANVKEIVRYFNSVIEDAIAAS